MKPNYINHIAFVIDKSASMIDHANAVVKVADNQIAHLAKTSKELDQETRVSVYLFNHHVECIIFDKDVLRLPSLASLYRAEGNTALIDATMRSQLDLRQTCTLYGDHSFLTFILTDGEENQSRSFGRSQLSAHLGTLRDNETVGLLVPDWRAKSHAESFGFHRDNIAIWDATSKQGMEEAMATIRHSTDNYMAARAAGVTNTRNLFSMDASAVNHQTVKNLKELSGFRVEMVKQPSVIKPFIESLNLPFITGRYFFPLIKRERIGPQKEVLIRHKISGKIYGGADARAVLGLPDHEVSVKPDPNAEFDVFVQSTSNNRNLIPGHELLIKV